MASLPKELAERIFLYLPVKSLCCVAQCNKLWRERSNHNAIWYGSVLLLFVIIVQSCNSYSCASSDVIWTTYIASKYTCNKSDYYSPASNIFMYSLSDTAIFQVSSLCATGMGQVWWRSSTNPSYASLSRLKYTFIRRRFYKSPYLQMEEHLYEGPFTWQELGTRTILCGTTSKRTQRTYHLHDLWR